MYFSVKACLTTHGDPILDHVILPKVIHVLNDYKKTY